MPNTAMNRRRDDAVTTWAAVAGVVLIVALLWAFGVVVQGQVQRADAKVAQPVPMQSVSMRCAPGRSAPCDAARVDDAGTDASPAVATPVPVAYR